MHSKLGNNEAVLFRFGRYAHAFILFTVQKTANVAPNAQTAYKAAPMSAQAPRVAAPTTPHSG
jgi:hypothetical protein